MPCISQVARVRAGHRLNSIGLLEDNYDVCAVGLIGKGELCQLKTAPLGAARRPAAHALLAKGAMRMNLNLDLDKCVPFISAELQVTSRDSPPARERPRPVVTISRQSGCGAHAVAEKLAAYLEAKAGEASCPWQVFDSNLVAAVLAEHKLPRRFAKFMPEDRASEMAETLDELLGVHPPSTVLVSHTRETILRLAGRGNVVLIGRGANAITSDRENVVHVRLVASLDKRLEHFRLMRDVPKAIALKAMRREDRARRRYVKQYFGMDLEDPLLYHLVINTGLISYDKAARLIGDAVLKGLCLR
jgi:cytidylate kinase